MVKNTVIISFILVFNLSIKAFEFKDTLKKIAHWSISAGPSWLEAKSYFDLLSDKKALDLVGNEDLCAEEADKIKAYLNEKICLNWKKIPIKVVKEDIRVYIQHALICTDSIIFINPDIYDLIGQEERNQNILEVGTLISQKYTLSSGIFLSILPIATHFGCEIYSKIIENLHTNAPDNFKSKKLESLVNGHNYIINSGIVKFFINKILTKRYFTYQENKNRKLVQKRLGSV